MGASESDEEEDIVYSSTLTRSQLIVGSNKEEQPLSRSTLNFSGEKALDYHA